MSTAPTQDSPTPDPWAVPAAAAGMPPETGIPLVPGPTQLSPRRAARQRKIRNSVAKYAQRATWPMAVRWTLFGIFVRLLAVAAWVAFHLDYAHLHSLAISRTTTAAEWESAVHTEQSIFSLWLLLWLATMIPNAAWLRTRGYLSTVLGAAPYPYPTQAMLETERPIPIPRYWPPVFPGTNSWTCHVRWRVLLVINWAYAVAIVSIAITLNTTGAVFETEFASVVSLIAAALMLILAGFDAVRLRAYFRWPRRA